MKLRVKVLPILLPVLLVVGLLCGMAVKIYREKADEASHTDLGQKYLNSTDYGNAAAEFAARLSEDPTDVAARRGLAQSYYGMGDLQLAEQVLQPLTEQKDPEAYRLLIQMETQVQDTSQALITARQLVSRTDDPEDRALEDDLLQQVLLQPRSYAAGADQQLLISPEGQLLSMGSNRTGQLGTQALLASNQQQTVFAPADFPGTAARVYCAGSTSYVVDADNNLWAAGENRWGQMGYGEADMTVQSGWRKVLDSGDVAGVAGMEGMLFVLKLDGSLWFAGNGGSMEFQRIGEFYQVSALESDRQRLAVLTLDGQLYVSRDGAVWSREARNVKQFSLCGNMLVWITTDGCIGGSGLSFPDTWNAGRNGTRPDFDVIRIACDGNGVLLQSDDGTLWRLYRGTAMKCEGISASTFYGENDRIILETDSGPQSWVLSEALPQPLK